MSTLRALAAAALLACASSSHALYANVTPPTGFSFSGGVLKYGGTPAAAMNWVSGASGISTSTSFVGRNFVVPGTARLAPGAGQAVARAVLSNPAMRLAPMLTWAAAALWVYDSVNQRFTVPDGTGEGYAPGFYEGWNNTHYTTREAAARSVIMGECARDGDACTIISIEVIEGIAHITYAKNGNPPTTTTRQPGYWNSPGCYDLATGMRIGYVGTGCAAGGTREATQADADALAEAHPMPDAVANEAQKVMPLPVAVPELSPVVQPIGQPRETPEGTVQDRVRITPANDEEAPWRVEETVETVPEGTDEETEGEEKPIDPCDEHPERVGCQTLEAPDDPGIPSETRTITYTADNLGFGSGCPAPRNFTFHGWALPRDYTPLCNVAPTIRLGLIAITALGCILIIIGVTRS
ncbi:virulence factor TspB C-terminal domain-related protein [Methylibium petroleiphilum]|uniref:virulence factor TspB C-terminal domain-related protein n=1 Tax=Methylibium petroleiphilum TaxID=105560 RepID=UPI003D2AFA05